MSKASEKVREISRKVYLNTFCQILIDYVQDEVEEILDNNHPTPDEVGACSYKGSIILEVFNPSFTTDIELLNELLPAIEAWHKELEFVNKSLGLDPNE